MPAPYYRLRVKSLKFISAVDAGAQGPVANVALIKRARGGANVDVTCRVAKLDEKMGLVFGWALASTLDGGKTPHVDLQNDAVVGDDELIKVAAEFVEAGAKSDVLHDETHDGRVVFCMPLTKDVNAALGIKSDVHGLAIAMRPSPATFKRFLSRELNAFSIGGLGQRELVKRSTRPRPVSKLAVLTSLVDGHQHTVDLDDPCDEWRDSLSTSYQTSEGAEQSHCHAWTYDPDTGAITIAADSGHTHKVTEIVPDDVRAEAAANEDGERCRNCNAMCDEHDRYCPACGKSMRSGELPCASPVAAPAPAPAVVVVAARAPGADSPPRNQPSTVNSNSQERPPMDPKIAKMFAAALLLPEPQRLHVAKLAAEDVPGMQAFMSLDLAGREAATNAALAADPVLYTTKSGEQIRKSHGDAVKKQAERNDQLAAQNEALQAEVAVSKAKTEQVELEKRAAEVIPMIGKAADERVAILRGVSAIADEALRTRTIEALKGANAALVQLTKMIGSNGGGGPEAKNPRDAWEAGLAEFAKSKSIAEPLDAIVPFLKTEQGKALKGAMDAQRPNAQPS